MAIDPKILELLVCPENRTPLAVAASDVLDKLNTGVAKGELKTRGGQVVNEPLVDALIREDKACVYRVDDGIPNMLVDDRIDL